MTPARVLRIAAAVALVGFVTYVDRQWLGVNSSTASFTYLLVVLGVATYAGLAESIAASVAGMLCYNFFFLPPVGAFTIADPDNWVALVAFLATAVTASHLSARARQQAAAAFARQLEVERLYNLSRQLMLTDARQGAAGQAALLVQRTFDAAEVALLDATSGRIHRAGQGELIEEELLRDAARGTAVDQPERGIAALPVSLGGQQLGGLGVRGAGLSSSAMQAATTLVAIGLERARTQEETGRAEAARQGARLKSALLDALAHELKTPLTSIKAAVTALLRRPNEPGEQDLLEAVNEETDRLADLVTESIEAARIEAGRVRLRRQVIAVQPLVDDVLARFKGALDGRPMAVCLPNGLPAIHGDSHLAALALRQLVDNALKYSPPGSPIGIAARLSQDGVVLTVDDEGPGIPEHEQTMVFERYYRGDDVRERIPGSGLGLAVARDIARAHGGDLWVERRPERGARFCLQLPAAPSKEHE